MTTIKMLPLSGQDLLNPVFFVNQSAGHAAIMNQLDERFFMLKTITDAFQVAGNIDGMPATSDVCRVLYSLIQEADSLSSLAYSDLLNSKMSAD